MIRSVLFLMISALMALPVSALTPPSGQWHWVAVDSAEVRIPKVDSIAKRLGLRPVKSADDKVLNYREPRALSFGFRFTTAEPERNGRADVWDSSWAVAFNSGGRFQAFLASAYLQEIRPEFRDGFPAFRDYGEIDQGVYHKRLWISSGYAWQQALKDNAMVTDGAKNFLVPLGYTADGIAVIALAAAAWPGASPEQRLGAALFAVGFTAFERLLMLPLGNHMIRQHNAVVRSGYRIPDFSSTTKTPRAPRR